jgi:hypothetical protein
MSLAETHTKVKASIWQAIATSGVNLAAVPQDDMNQLVEAITEGILKDLDDALSRATGQPASVTTGAVDADSDDEVEKVLWEGRPFLSLSVHYTITTERVRITEGMLGKDREDIDLVRIKDIDQSQSLTERALNIGDIHIHSHDASQSEVTLNNISNPMEVHEILRQAVLKARKKYKVGFREEM